MKEIITVNRFYNVAVCAEGITFLYIRVFPGRCKNYNRDGFKTSVGLNFLQHLYPRYFWHFQVEQYEFRIFLNISRSINSLAVNKIERLGAIFNMMKLIGEAAFC